MIGAWSNVIGDSTLKMNRRFHNYNWYCENYETLSNVAYFCPCRWSCFSDGIQLIAINWYNRIIVVNRLVQWLYDYNRRYIKCWVILLLQLECCKKNFNQLLKYCVRCLMTFAESCDNRCVKLRQFLIRFSVSYWLLWNTWISWDIDPCISWVLCKVLMLFILKFCH